MKNIMRKITAFIIIAAMLFTLAACKEDATPLDVSSLTVNNSVSVSSEPATSSDESSSSEESSAPQSSLTSTESIVISDENEETSSARLKEILVDGKEIAEFSSF